MSSEAVTPQPEYDAASSPMNTAQRRITISIAAISTLIVVTTAGALLLSAKSPSSGPLTAWLLGSAIAVIAAIVGAGLILRRSISRQTTRSAQVETPLDHAATLTQITKQICQALDATSCYISSINLETSHSTVLSEYYGPQASEQEQVSDVGEVYERINNQMISAVRADRAYSVRVDDPDILEEERETLLGFGAKSVLYVPLHSRGDIGTYAEVWETRQFREFTPEEAELCRAIARGTTAVVENVRLQFESRRREERLNTLLKLGAGLVSSLNYEQVLQAVCREMVQLLDTTSVYVSVWEEEGQSSTVLAEWYGPEASDAERVSDLGETYGEVDYIADWLRSGQPHVAHRSDSGLPEESLEEMEEYGVKSMLYVPLKSQARNIGYLEIWESRYERIFSREETHLAQSLANMAAIALENARLIEAIQEAAQELNTAAAEILTASTQQAAGSSEQAASISQTSTTVDEVKVISEQAVQRAREVVDASQRTVETSDLGLESVRHAINSMKTITHQVGSIAENIVALAEQTQQIGEIVASVSDISAQSNMLALNASVEAARAGVQGTGFAVVAAEVRNLAEQSQQATSQIRDILLAIHDKISSTVDVTEEGTKAVQAGANLAAHAERAIEELAAAIAESSQTAMQVMAGGQQQVSGIDQISLAMNNINQASAQTVASTRQMEQAARDLSELAERLNELVQQHS